MIEIEGLLVISVIWSFLVSVFAIPSIIHVAHIKNLLDRPNNRTVHVNLTPRLGGLAIFAGFISAITIFGHVTLPIQRVIAGSMLLFFIGLKDDIVSISPFKKFLVQGMATGIIVYLGNIRITNLQGFMGIYDLPDGISYGLTFLVIIGITNAVNLIDGLDGLAGSLTLLMCLTFGVFFFLNGEYASAKMAFCLVGGVLGFLRYNFHKAVIFMGDTGSLLCGFLVSVMAIQFIELKTVQSAPSIALAICIVPVFDTIRVFTLRILAGKPPFAPDKNHIHHIMLRANLSQIETVLVLVVANMLIVSTVVFFAGLGDNILLPAIVVVAILTTLALNAMDIRNKRKLKAIQGEATLTASIKSA